MKKILIALALGATLIGAAHAQHRDFHHHHRPVIVERTYTGGDVLVPLIIGGMIGAVIANSNQQQVIVQPQPQVIVQQPQSNGFIQCPPGTMPFEQRGWVRNQYNQFVQATYIECK